MMVHVDGCELAGEVMIRPSAGIKCTMPGCARDIQSVSYFIIIIIKRQRAEATNMS